MNDPIASAISPLPPEYHDLFDRVRRSADTDQRIRALWLSGSLARGVADIGSDLDVIVTIADDDRAEFADGWREWLAAITPTLIAKPLPFAPGSFYSTTVDGCRLDVVVESVSELPKTPHRRRIPVFDRDGLTIPEPAEPNGPDEAKMRELVEEFFRQQAIFPAAVVGRNDWLLGVEGVHNARLMLYQLFVEANQPLPPMGVKQWSAKLTEPQRKTLESLPVPAADAESVTEAMRATREAFYRAGTEILGPDWPTGLQNAVDALLSRP
jgi:hypothetical protein